MGALDKIIEARGLRPKAESESDRTTRELMTVISKLAKREEHEMSNVQLAKGLIASLEEIQRSVDKMVKSIDPAKANKGLASAVQSIADTQKGLVKQVQDVAKSVVEDRNGPVIEAVNNLRAAIQSVELPEPDLTPIMAEMRRMKPPKRPELKMILDKLETPEKWEFTVDRDQYSDRIESVTATKVS